MTDKEKDINSIKMFLRGKFFMDEGNRNVDCVYAMVDEKDLSRIENFDFEEADDEDYEFAEDLLWNELGLERFSTKLHIALEFLLTGFAKNGLTENNKKIRDAIEGIGDVPISPYDLFSTPGCVRCIENIELSDIIKALENININDFKEKFHPKLFWQNKIYPYGIWNKHLKEYLFSELVNAYNTLLDFYKRAKEKNAHVIVMQLGEAYYGQWEDVPEDDFRQYYNSFYGNWESDKADYDECEE